MAVRLRRLEPDRADRLGDARRRQRAGCAPRYERRSVIPQRGSVSEPRKSVRDFFEAYARATASLDTAFLEAAYADTFMFAGPSGAMTVRRDDFLRVVPRRKAAFDAAGLTATELRSIEETPLDEHYVQVKAHWTFRFEKERGRPIVEPAAATYILRRDERGLRILFQIDHQDLTRRLQELGAP